MRKKDSPAPARVKSQDSPEPTERCGRVWHLSRAQRKDYLPHHVLVHNLQGKKKKKLALVAFSCCVIVCSTCIVWLGSLACIQDFQVNHLRQKKTYSLVNHVTILVNMAEMGGRNIYVIWLIEWFFFCVPIETVITQYLLSIRQRSDGLGKNTQTENRCSKQTHTCNAWKRQKSAIFRPQATRDSCIQLRAFKQRRVWWTGR